MPIYEGNGVRLRAAERSDIPTFVRWFSDPEVTANLDMVGIMSRANEEMWFEDMIKRPIMEQVMVMEVQDPFTAAGQTRDWTPIGTISLFDWNTLTRSAELGIAIGEKAYWNQGFGSEAIRILLDMAFKNYNLHRVELRVVARNARAIRAYQKVGFVLEGTKREAAFKDGRYVDMHVMSVLSHEWEQMRGREG